MWKRASGKGTALTQKPKEKNMETKIHGNKLVDRANKWCNRTQLGFCHFQREFHKMWYLFVTCFYPINVRIFICLLWPMLHLYVCEWRKMWGIFFWLIPQNYKCGLFGCSKKHIYHMNVYNGFQCCTKERKKKREISLYEAKRKKNNILVPVIVVTAVRISDLGLNKNLQMVFQKFLDRI